jgi:uncharacterized SAM-binding protein YcdF (DUF218 family)
MPRAPGAPISRTLCLLAGAALLADSLFLLAQRVFSFGVALPLAIGGALLFFGLRWRTVDAWLDASRSRRRMWRWGWAGFWLWIASVALFWMLLAQWTTGQHALPSQPAAAIVVLGSGTPAGKVSPVLAARLDLAYERALASPGAVVVASGGVNFNQARSEAAVMGDYLRSKGMPPTRIVQEEQSISTAHNLLLSRRLLEERGIVVARDPVELVTSDFHTLRARWIAQRAGYAQPRMVGAPTPLYVRYNAWLREYFAVISGFLLGEY